MKSNKEVNTVAAGVGFLDLLTVAFVVLKLCNVINWSWWWVLSPIWIPFIIILVAIVIMCYLFR